MPRYNSRAKNGLNLNYDDMDDFGNNKSKSKLDRLNETLKDNDAVLPAILDTIKLLKQFRKERIERESHNNKNDSFSKEYLNLKKQELSQNRDSIKKIEKISKNFKKPLDNSNSFLYNADSTPPPRNPLPHNVHSTYTVHNKQYTVHKRNNKELNNTYNRENENNSYKEIKSKERKVNETRDDKSLFGYDSLSIDSNVTDTTPRALPTHTTPLQQEASPHKPLAHSTPPAMQKGSRLKQAYYWFLKDKHDYDNTFGNTGLSHLPSDRDYGYADDPLRLDNANTLVPSYKNKTTLMDYGYVDHTLDISSRKSISAPAPVALSAMDLSSNKLTIKTERVELIKDERSQDNMAHSAISAPALDISYTTPLDYNANAISAERYEQEQEYKARYKSEQDHIHIRERLTDDYREEHLRKLNKLIQVVSQNNDKNSADDPSMLDLMLDTLNPFSNSSNVKKPSLLKRSASFVGKGANAIAKGGSAMLSNAINLGTKGAGALGVGLQAGLSAYDYFTADNTQQRKKAVGSGVGGAVGAVLGSFIPVPIVGTMLGGWIGSKVGGLASSWLSKPQDMIPDDVKQEGKRAELQWINDNVPILFENKQITQKDVKGFNDYKDKLMQELSKEYENTTPPLIDYDTLQPAIASQALAPQPFDYNNEPYPNLESIDRNEVYSSHANIATHNVSNVTNNIMQMQPYRLSDKDTLFLTQYGY